MCLQDFFGLIEEMRVWRVVRTPEQIRQGMIADDGRGAGADFNHPGIDKDHKGEGGGGGRWGPGVSHVSLSINQHRCSALVGVPSCAH